jgi:hypothetical protein
MSRPTMRPSDSAVNLRAGFLALHNPPYAVALSTLSADTHNAQWALEDAGHGLVRIVSLYTLKKLALTPASAGAQGEQLYAQVIEPGPNQLWSATNSVGKLWNFVRPNTGLCMQAIGGIGAPLILAPFDPSGEGNGQLWVFPNDD